VSIIGVLTFASVEVVSLWANALVAQIDRFKPLARNTIHLAVSLQISVDMNANEIRQRMAQLLEEHKALEQELKTALVGAINEAATESPHNKKKISKHIFIINASDLMGNPWNVEFYDWEASASVVLDYLMGKPIYDWKTLLESKIASAKRNVVEFKKQAYCMGYKTCYTIPISKEFIEKIVAKM
jgi:hypothetical protein